MDSGVARTGRPAEAGLPASVAARPRPVRSPSQGFIRIAILAALLLLAVYTAFGIQRLRHEAGSSPRDAALAAQAGGLAGRVETSLAAQRAGLSAAADLLRRNPAAPIDAAEIALRAAGGEALAVAVVGSDGVSAVAGVDPAADWRRAAATAAASKRRLWIGSAGDTGRLYVALAEPAGWVIASGDPGRLLRTDGDALALADGRLLAGRGDALGG
ncbi:MAG: sensor signal transduction histidine kinase, partial [Caulobacter sp.]|nr:sensor signal transduction histidine kinase [Caulobacter sp.]